jgi:hypothetical protein
MAIHGWTRTERQIMAACSPKRHAPWRWLMVAVLFGLAAGRLNTAAAPASAKTTNAEHVAAARQAKVIPAQGNSTGFWTYCSSDMYRVS